MDVKFIARSTKGFTLPPGFYEITDIYLMLKSLLPKEVQVKITIDDIRLKSNLTTNKRNKFTKRSFFYIILGFTQSLSYPVNNIGVFYQLIAG